VFREGDTPGHLPLPARLERWAVFLDFDGTLVPIAARPIAVRWRPLLGEHLIRLQHHLDGALAVVSGRAAHDVARIIAPVNVVIAGLHGLEWRDIDGHLMRHRPDDAVLTGVAANLQMVADLHPGLEIEEKGLGIAVHYRRAPHLANFVRETLARLTQNLGSDYELQTGKMVLEIKLAGRNKGTVITECMAMAPFQGRTPVFVGDDDTDEIGFECVNSMGGVSIKVGGGQTCARRRARSVSDVWRWIRAVNQRLE